MLTSDNQLSNWRSLANLQSLAGTAGGRACDLTSLTAVSFNSGDPVIGGRCGKPGAVGILAELAGTWQLVGPKLPSSLARAGVEVLSLQPTDNGLSVLLGVSHGASKSLIAAWTSNGDWQWTTSPVLRVGPSDRVESFGPAAGGGFFVLFSGGSANKLEVLDDPGGRWDLLPPPPTGTATVTFNAGASIDALVVNDTVMTDWSLDSGATVWTKGRAVSVPIQFGSSAGA